MKVKTKVTFREYLRLLFSLAYQRPIMKILVCLAIIILLWIIFHYLNFFNTPQPLIYPYITLALIIVVQPIVIYTTIRSNYYSSNHLRETLEMELLPAEMKIEGESFYMEVKWDKLHKIMEMKNYFLIYQNNLSAIIIPKKDLNESDIINFRQILNNLDNVPVEILD